MFKLTPKEVREIVRRLNAPYREISVYGLSRVYGVTPQWIWEIRRRAELGLPLPGTGRNGRPRKLSPAVYE